MQILGTTISLEHDASGQPALLIQATPTGALLARLLTADAPLAPPEAHGYRVPYTSGVDDRVRELADSLVEIRFSQPAVMQLALWR